MERVTYRKGELHRIACTPAEHVRLEHAGWTRVNDDPGALSPEGVVPDPAELATPESGGATPPRRRGKTSS